MLSDDITHFQSAEKELKSMFLIPSPFIPLSILYRGPTLSHILYMLHYGTIPRLLPEDKVKHFLFRQLKKSV